MPRREATPCPDPSASPQAPGRQLPRELRSPQEKANPPNTDATVPRAGGVSAGPGQRARPHLEAPDDQQGVDVVVTDVLHDFLHVALGQSPAAGDGQTDTQRPHRPQDGSTHVHAAPTCPSPQGAGPVGLRFLVRGGSGGSRPRAYGGHCGGPAPAHHPHRPLARRLGSPSALRPGCELPAGVGPQSSASHPGDRRRARPASPRAQSRGWLPLAAPRPSRSRHLPLGCPWRPAAGRSPLGPQHGAAAPQPAGHVVPAHFLHLQGGGTASGGRPRPRPTPEAPALRSGTACPQGHRGRASSGRPAAGQGGAQGLGWAQPGWTQPLSLLL